MGKNHFINIDLIKLLFKNMKTIVIVFVIMTVLAAVFSLILPEDYRAQTTILPPLDEDGFSSFAALISDLPLNALGLSSAPDQTTLFLATLKSRTLMEAVANKFGLIQLYKKKNMEETIKTLRKYVSTYLEDEGTITLSAIAKTSWFPLFNRSQRDTARILAKDMANAFIEELDKINRQLKTERARNTRIYIEKRYEQNITELYQAEEALKSYQIQYGTIALPEQTQATIAAATEIKVQMIAKEVEIGVLQRSVGPTHSELIRAQNELIELGKKYDELESWQKETPVNDDDQEIQKSLLLPLNDLPDLGLQYLRLHREVVLQETIKEFLLPQYEQAKIQEVKDTPSLQVLDNSLIPIRKHRPKRAMIVLFFGFLSLIFSSLYITTKPAILKLYNELKA
jgi:uncharacterized protein involved in exopolysaccharide biosynthesis